MSNKNSTPIVNQPQAGGQLIQGDNTWMPKPAPQVNYTCPPGLEYLTLIDQLIIKQKVDRLEVLTGFDTKNKYTLKNTLGQNVYAAAEESGFWGRCCLGSYRPFNMKVLDNGGQEVIHLYRHFAAYSCCCPCWMQKLEVSSPPGVPIGTVEQEWSLIMPNFVLKDANGDPVLRIVGPCCTFDLCRSVDFKIVALNGEEIGRISKRWSGAVKELFTNADTFGISFPLDLDVRVKALLIGAVFLVDYLFFESNNGACTFE